MPPQYREISHKNVSTRCDILSFRRRESGMLISRFLGRSCEKRRGGSSSSSSSSSSSNRIDFRSRERYHPSTRREFDEGRPTHGMYTCAHVYRFKKTVPSSPFSSRNRYSESFFGRRPTAFETAFIVLRFFLPFRFGSRLTDDRKLRMEFDFEVRCACMEWQRRPPRKWIKMLSLMAPSRRDGERLRFLIAR